MDCYRCLIQWGYLQKQAEKWIYPIPVLEAFIATKTCISNNHSAAGYVGYWTWDKDITTEYAYSWNNYPSYCFMIGKVQQQWGFKEHNNTHQSTVKLPIAFKNSGYVGAANDSGTVTIGIKPTDKQTIELRDNNGGGKTGIYWFVVGQ